MIARWRSLLQAESAQRHTASQQSVIERAERDVHVAEHSDDFVDQFHDGFLFGFGYVMNITEKESTPRC